MIFFPGDVIKLNLRRRYISGMNKVLAACGFIGLSAVAESIYTINNKLREVSDRLYRSNIDLEHAIGLLELQCARNKEELIALGTSVGNSGSVPLHATGKREG